MLENKLYENFNANSPTDLMWISKIKSHIGIQLPQDYIDFMTESNGGEGFIGPNSYIIIWKLEELLDLNNSYQVPEYAPGIFLFGSDGCGDAYGFDIRNDEIQIVSIPFVGMDNKLITNLGSNFTIFLNNISNN